MSKDEQEFIRRNAGILATKTIARRLKRTEEAVTEYIRDNCEVSLSVAGDDDDEDAKIKYDLKSSAVWVQLSKEFESEELDTFEEQYVAMKKQFANDLVLASEENQIIKAIKYDLLMSRNLQQQKRTMREIAKLELEQEDAQSSNDEEESLRLETLLAAAYASKQAKTTEYTKLEEKHQKLMEALKATREQRIDRVQSAKHDFIHLIKMLHEDDVRDREGRMAQRAKMAAKRELDRLGTAHEYADGQFDCPIYNADVIDRVVREEQAGKALCGPKEETESEK